MTAMISNAIVGEAVHAQLDKQLCGISNLPFNTNAGQILVLVLGICETAYQMSRSPIKLNGYGSPEECDRFLAQNKLILDILQRCHLSGQYAEIRERPEFHIPPTPSSSNKPSNYTPLNTTPPSHTTSNFTIKKLIDKFIDKLKPEIKKYFCNPNLPTWQAPGISDEDTRRFFQGLAIPEVDNKPNFLLHGIGIDPYSSDNKLFDLTKRHRILCNTSGAGKTRLIFDGLCHHWGFYFVTTQDSGGISHSDLEATIENLEFYRGWVKDIFAEGVDKKCSHSSNKDIAFRQFYKLLLSRWIIFNTFIEVAKEQNNGNLPKDIKHQWLLFQIFPSVFVDDQPSPFIALINHCLAGADAQFLREQLNKFTALKILGTAFNPTQENFFYVLDKAQVASCQYLGAFANQDGSAPQPVLHPLIQAWSGVISAQSTRFIVSGTGFSLSHFQTVLTSGIGKDLCSSHWDVIHETGNFMSQEIQAAYISRYLPLNFLYSSSGQALQRRMYEWLRGRHQFTARFIELLIQGQWEVDCPGSPHKFLNAYIHTFTNFYPLDGDTQLLAKEPDVLPPQMDVFSWDKISSELKADLSTSLYHYIARGVYPMWFTDHQDLVEIGIARFMGTGSVTVEEPLALMSIMQYFDKEKFNLEFEIWRDMQTDRGLAFEEAVLVACTKIFGPGANLDDVFNFHGTVPSWAQQRAKIVTRGHGDTLQDFDIINGKPIIPSTGVAYNAKNPKEIRGWIEAKGTGCCIPGVYMGPDLMTWLRLADGQLLLLVIQAKCYENGNKDTLAAAVTANAIQSITPSQFFKYKCSLAAAASKDPESNPTQEEVCDMLDAVNSPEECFTGAKYNILRVIAAYPLDANFNSCAATVKDALKTDHHPLATLRHDVLTASLATEGQVPSILEAVGESLKRSRARSKSESQTGTKRKR